MLKGFMAAAAVIIVLGRAVGAEAGPFEEGGAAIDRSDYATALKLLQPLAEEGNANAQFELGVAYARSFIPTEAVKWYRLAAEQGHTNARSALGSLYFVGLFVPRDDAEALKWFRLAAEQGDAHAQQNLGYMYQKGKGVPQDFVLSHMWFNLAAAQGDANGRNGRDIVAALMTPDQIAEAQRLAREWKPYSKQ